MLCARCLSMFLGPQEGPHHEYIDDVEKASDNGCFICYRLLYIIRRYKLQALEARRVSDHTTIQGTGSRVDQDPRVPSRLRYYFAHNFLGVGDPKKDVVIQFKHEGRYPHVEGYRQCLENAKKALEEMVGYGVQDTHLKDPFTERSYTGGSVALEFALERLRDCRRNHSECRDAALALSKAERPESESWRPKRLIDCYVKDERLHLVRGEDLEILDYATLNNEDQALGSKIPLAELPLTFRQAILVCRSLRIRYLWIDSICIIQSGDNGDDWLLHAREMSTIYTFCTLNIAAEHASNPNQGLFINRMLRPPLVLAPAGESGAEVRDIMLRSSYYLDSNMDLSLVPDEIYRLEPSTDSVAETAVMHTTLSTRGWVMQERLLSRRTLHFSRHQIAWSCYALTTSEHEREDGLSWVDRLKPDLITTDQPGTELQVAHWWLRTVQEYAGRQLSYPEKDKLVAIAGIARVFNHVRRFKYLAGIFRAHLPWALLWHRRHIRRWTEKDQAIDDQPHGREPFAPGGVPSWSWASSNFPIDSYPVRTHLDCLLEGESLVDIKGAEVDLSDTGNPYGQVTGGEIEFEGYLGLKEDFDHDGYTTHYDGRFKENGGTYWHIPLIQARRGTWPDLFGIIVQGNEGTGLFYRVGIFKVGAEGVSRDIIERRSPRRVVTLI
ncbi:hypothetical protein NM208_g4951 [Fusarium decemcellulare]|uniref:Uncharacterized protein n=1 Tax=Fusarium decemcellulare TaxID=57161 RepID=A0ACC1SIX3_9HYPO|nr:hypothetical protein NM208_g4951 [Fusarium decemcellulare]